MLYARIDAGTQFKNLKKLTTKTRRHEEHEGK